MISEDVLPPLWRHLDEISEIDRIVSDTKKQYSATVSAYSLNSIRVSDSSKAWLAIYRTKTEI